MSTFAEVKEQRGMRKKIVSVLCPVLVAIALLVVFFLVIFKTDPGPSNMTILHETLHKAGIDSPLPIKKIETAKGTVGWFSGSFSGSLGVYGEMSGKQAQSVSITVYWETKSGLFMNTLPINKVQVLRGPKPTLTVVYQDFAQLGGDYQDEAIWRMMEMSDAEIVEKYGKTYILTLPPNIYDKEFGK